MKKRLVWLFALLLSITTFAVCGPIAEVWCWASCYLGVPYVSGTLDVSGEERLVLDTTGLDCTTFVELSVARRLAMHDTLTFEQHVQALRYRNGVIDGYLSRLHYFSDWVSENTRRGVWFELSPSSPSGIWRNDTLALAFMSCHPNYYPYLKNNAWAVDSMRTIERRYTGLPFSYIAKEYLNFSPSQLPIRDGDIIALVTTIEGLDVTHLGFAVWVDEKLHLMHASMSHCKVVIDDRTLYDYLKDRSSCPGVRVVRLCR